MVVSIAPAASPEVGGMHVHPDVPFHRCLLSRWVLLNPQLEDVQRCREAPTFLFSGAYVAARRRHTPMMLIRPGIVMAIAPPTIQARDDGRVSATLAALWLCGLLAGSAANALPFQAGDLVYDEDLNTAAFPTSPETDSIGAGGLVAGGSDAPSFYCPPFGSCRLDLDVSLASPGVANAYMEMSAGTIGTSSFGIDADFSLFLLSSSGDDSTGRARLSAQFPSGTAQLELVRDRQGVDEWRLELSTSAGASASRSLPAAVAAALATGDDFSFDFYVDRTGHWITGAIQVTDLPDVTTEAVNFFAGTEPLTSIRMEAELTNGAASPTLYLSAVDFEVYLPATPPLEEGLITTGMQQIHNEAGWLTDPGSPGTNSGMNVLSDGSQFGAPLGIDDLDGDGIDDLIVGAEGPGGGFGWGELLVLFLNTDGTVKGLQQIDGIVGGFGGLLSTGDRFGASLHWLGPLTGGGAPWLAVGAPGKVEGSTSGSVFLLQMATNGTVLADHRIADGIGGLPASSLAGLDEFGSDLASPGDLDGDGIPELAVGAPLDDHGGGSSDDAGAVWILFLDSSGQVKASPAPVQITSTSAGVAIGDRFGTGLEGLGDLDGAGPSVGALAVGSPGAGASGEGAVTILFLDANGQVTSDTTIDAASGDLPAGNPISGAQFGHRLAHIGDIDNDGIGELAVGAPNTIPPLPFSGTQGAVWLLFLDASGGVTRSELLPTLGDSLDGVVGSTDGFGFPGRMGDLDGNGIDELVIGAPWDRNFYLDREGAVHILFLEERTCGDGRAVASYGEQCDDGNLSSGDGCSDVCIAEFCGDGILMPALGEVCEDANSVSEDGCSSACIPEFCGDGVVQAGLGETCDDGNTVSDDGCNATCIAEVCGDGVLQPGIGEVCDDANSVSEDGCSDQCLVESCGDGVLQAGLGESCDDANQVSEDGCSNVCIAEFCGDGIVQAGLGESCEDGNASSFDGCSASCTDELLLFTSGTGAGGQLDFRVGDVTVSVATGSGDSDADVATALAAAINTDATLSGMGITAAVQDNALVVGGTPTAFGGNDGGLALGAIDPDSFAELVGVWRTLDFESFGSGATLASGSSVETVAFDYALEGAIIAVTDAFDAISPTNSAGATGGDDALLDGDVVVWTFDRPVLGLAVYVVTSDLAESGEIRLVTPQGTVSNLASPLYRLADGGYVYFLAQLAGVPMASASLVFAGDGEINFLYDIDDVMTSVGRQRHEAVHGDGPSAATPCRSRSTAWSSRS